MKYRREVALGLALLAAVLLSGNVHARHYSIGMPTVETIEHAMAVGDQGQSLGRQCYAMKRLLDVLYTDPTAPPELKDKIWLDYYNATRSIRSRYHALQRTGVDDDQWAAMCSGEHDSSGKSRDADVAGFDQPPPTDDELKALLKGWALDSMERWQNTAALRATSKGNESSSPPGKPLSSRFKDFLEPFMGVLGIPMILLGIGGVVFVAARRFNRRNEYGVQIFDSYGQMVGAGCLETTIGGASIIIAVAGAMMLVLS